MTRIWIGIIKKPIEGGGVEGPVADIIGSLKSGEGFFCCHFVGWFCFPANGDKDP